MIYWLICMCFALFWGLSTVIRSGIYLYRHAGSDNVIGRKDALIELIGGILVILACIVVLLGCTPYIIRETIKESISASEELPMHFIME